MSYICPTYYKHKLKMGKAQVNKTVINKLKKMLPHGSIGRIAKELGISRRTVERTFRGDYYNRKVIAKAEEIAREEKQKQEELDKKIEETISK